MKVIRIERFETTYTIQISEAELAILTQGLHAMGAHLHGHTTTTSKLYDALNTLGKGELLE